MQNIKDLIIRMEVTALEEWNKGNPSAFLEIYSPDITYFDPMQEKRVDGLALLEQLYAEVRGKICVDRYEMINPLVQISGRTAVLSYNLLSYVEDQLHKWNCTEVYQLNENDEWKIIHNHWSLTQSPAK